MNHESDPFEEFRRKRELERLKREAQILKAQNIHTQEVHKEYQARVVHDEMKAFLDESSRAAAKALRTINDSRKEKTEAKVRGEAKDFFQVVASGAPSRSIPHPQAPPCEPTVAPWEEASPTTGAEKPPLPSLPDEDRRQRSAPPGPPAALPSTGGGTASPRVGEGPNLVNLPERTLRPLSAAPGDLKERWNALVKALRDKGLLSLEEWEFLGWP